MKRIAVFLATAALGLSFATPAGAGSPVRSGSVAGGPIDTGPSSRCELAPDCVAWLASRCSPHLAGVDPAVQTSIVDVRDLAGSSTTRHFVVRPTHVARKSGVIGVHGVVIGGFRIQLWDARCKEVQPTPPIFDSKTSYYHYPQYIRNESRFQIPAGVAWMTATADDNVLISWELW